jgi:hypothetical protein
MGKVVDVEAREHHDHGSARLSYPCGGHLSVVLQVPSLPSQDIAEAYDLRSPYSSFKECKQTRQDGVLRLSARLRIAPSCSLKPRPITTCRPWSTTSSRNTIKWSRRLGKCYSFRSSRPKRISQPRRKFPPFSSRVRTAVGTGMGLPDTLEELWMCDGDPGRAEGSTRRQANDAFGYRCGICRRQHLGWDGACLQQARCPSPDSPSGAARRFSADGQYGTNSDRNSSTYVVLLSVEVQSPWAFPLEAFSPCRARDVGEGL